MKKMVVRVNILLTQYQKNILLTTYSICIRLLSILYIIDDI